MPSTTRLTKYLPSGKSAVETSICVSPSFTGILLCKVPSTFVILIAVPELVGTFVLMQIREEHGLGGNQPFLLAGQSQVHWAIALINVVTYCADVEVCCVGGC